MQEPNKIPVFYNIHTVFFSSSRLCHCSQGPAVNTAFTSSPLDSNRGDGGTVHLLFRSQYSDFAQLRCHGSGESVGRDDAAACNVISLYVK